MVGLSILSFLGVIVTMTFILWLIFFGIDEDI